MTRKTRYHLIGLWRIWDVIEDVPDPRKRSPEGLLERHAGSFAVVPDAKTIRAVFTVEENALEPNVETSELVGHVVLDETAWTALKAQTGWTGLEERRHAPGADRLVDPTAYGLDRGAIEGPDGSAWAPARDYGPPIAGVTRRLEAIGDAMGLPPVEFGPEVPFFEGRTRSPVRHHHRYDRARDRDTAGD